ncbi:hypothetical protein V4F39_06250 [Aquincola sp. MAHUQ-54]|uniref:Lipoprotein n=1 Tax=Aquincola agrisoli TaxID=3119538 RepID=A0AAW9QAX5_9BURK
MKKYWALSHLAVALAVAAGLLAGCGGGSDDEAGGNPSADTYNVRAAMANLLTQGGSWTGLAGRASNGVNYTVALSSTPGARQNFPKTGELLDRTTQVLTVEGGGERLSASTSVYYNRTTGKLAGTLDEDNNCSVITHTVDTLPTAARAGDNGEYFRTVDYTGCSSVIPTGGSRTNWSLDAVGGRAYFCLSTTYTDGSGVESECVQVETDGSLRQKARVFLRLIDGGDTFELDASN